MSGRVPPPSFQFNWRRPPFGRTPLRRRAPSRNLTRLPREPQQQGPLRSPRSSSALPLGPRSRGSKRLGGWAARRLVVPLGALPGQVVSCCPASLVSWRRHPGQQLLGVPANQPCSGLASIDSKSFQLPALLS